MPKVVKENYLSLDLELNQPSNKIIQVGSVVGNVFTGEILEEICSYVKIDEPLSEKIVKLTGIKQRTLDEQGGSLLEAYNRIVEASVKYNFFRNPLTWGGGDTWELRKQLGETDKWVFGYRFIDVKTIYQSFCIANDRKVQSGLAKSSLKLGMPFQGKKHNAVDDAKNTFFVYKYFLDNFLRIKGGQNERKSEETN